MTWGWVPRGSPAPTPPTAMTDRQVYATKMKQFFAAYDSWQPREYDRYWLPEDAPKTLSPEIVAKRYARFFWEEGRKGQVVGIPTTESISNLSVAYRGFDLANLARRIQVVSDVSMFTHFREARHEFSSFDQDVPHPGAPGIFYQSYIRCDNLAELGKWLLDCRPLLEAGDICYYPDILVEESIDFADGFVASKGRGSRELSVANLMDVMITHGKVVDQSHGGLKKSRLVYPILRVDLPFVDEIDMATFASISLDYRDALARARDSLRDRFLALDELAGAENLETSIARISIELRDSIRELDSEYKKLKRTRAFSCVGASLGSASATLALSTTFAPALALVGAGGGLIGLAKAFESHFENRQKLRERQFYFFWLLSRQN